MKYEDIAKVKIGQAFSCKGCGKRICFGAHRIHFCSPPEQLTENSFENIEPLCEECHNLMFGEDIDISLLKDKSLICSKCGCTKWISMQMRDGEHELNEFICEKCFSPMKEK